MEIAKRYELGTYPLLLMLRYGERYNYTGPRDEDGEAHAAMPGVWCTVEDGLRGH